jgi:hypothetical protein
MNKRFSKIIREEINRLILSEALDVSPLSKYIQPLKNCASELKNIGVTKNKEVDAFINDLITYVIQIIFGIDRCVRANSLNEYFSLRNYGIEYPAELGGNFFNDFESGFYKGSNWVNRTFNGRASGRRNGNNNTNVNNSNPTTPDVNNPNTVPTVRLEESLRNFAQMSLRFKDITSRYPNIISQYSGTFFDALDEVNKVYDEFRQIKNNAQGANP